MKPAVISHAYDTLVQSVVDLLPAAACKSLLYAADTPEQHYVGLWSVDGIVLPAAGLLDAKAPPLILQRTRRVC